MYTESNNTLHLVWNQEGCFSETHLEPGLVLESMEELDPRWSPGKPTYMVNVKVTLHHNYSGPFCRMAQQMEIKINLEELFMAKAKDLGIDLASKKAKYSVRFISPGVTAREHF